MGFSESGEKIEIDGQKQFFIDEPQQTDDQAGRLFLHRIPFFLQHRGPFSSVIQPFGVGKNPAAAPADRIAGIPVLFHAGEA